MKGYSPKYKVSAEMRDRIGNNFTYHAPTEDQIERYSVIREHGRVFATLICELTPQSREQSVALTKIEEFVMWANAAIARNEDDG